MYAKRLYVVCACRSSNGSETAQSPAIAFYFLQDTYTLELGLHRISYPGPAPAEIRPNFHIAGYEVGFDHLSMHLPHCVIGQEFIVLQIR